MLAPFGDRVIEALNPPSGAEILEIGCSTGGKTLALAERTGPAGMILAVDISRPLLRRATARTNGIAAPAIMFVETDAQVRSFGGGQFDARCLATLLVDCKAGVTGALKAYEAERLPMTADIVRTNRKGGPEQVIDLVEERAPNGFEKLSDVATHEELEA
ncbi:MAG: methyltransferase domain-containing protein, partial [Gammaproteobacteria bacterium]